MDSGLELRRMRISISQSGKMFGKDRFKDVIRCSAHKPAAIILKNVYDEVFQFTGGLKPQDDITLVIVKLEAC